MLFLSWMKSEIFELHNLGNVGIQCKQKVGRKRLLWRQAIPIFNLKSAPSSIFNF